MLKNFLAVLLEQKVEHWLHTILSIKAGLQLCHKENFDPIHKNFLSGWVAFSLTYKFLRCSSISIPSTFNSDCQLRYILFTCSFNLYNLGDIQYILFKLLIMTGTLQNPSFYPRTFWFQDRIYLGHLSYQQPQLFYQELSLDVKSLLSAYPGQEPSEKGSICFQRYES